MKEQAARIEQALKDQYRCQWCKKPLTQCTTDCPNSKIWPDSKTVEQFTKFDSGKLRYRLLPPFSIRAVLEVLEYGAKKYSPDNWRKCDDKMRYYDAAMRHLEAWRQGEKVDPESKLPHLWHAACNLIFLVELD